MSQVTILGAGSWGSALASVLAWNGHSVRLWSHNPAAVSQMKKDRGIKNLPGFLYPEGIEFFDDIGEALSGSSLVVFAVPSTATRQTAGKVKPCFNKNVGYISVSKGIEEDSLMTQTEIIEDELPGVLVGALSGPSHAEEVIRKLPTVLVAGAKDFRLAKKVQDIFMDENLRVYTSSDVKGIEVGASLKNVIALAAGMSDGLGNGDNARAALITRGIREITAIAVAMGGKPDTLAGLAGIGDLIVTCSSVHSRNHQAGELIGQGVPVKEAMERIHMVVEGVYSAKAAFALGRKYKVSMPIITEVNQVLFCNKSAKDAVHDLMCRDKKSEISGDCWE
ncbi:MAG: NAD(P)-dependent glycerol-3-phosphate dehydrogenase [Lachnospiraceae bacterium]|uniref:Glycerol-3-phosphate dehydrogenase [NAD(P)+] n=1 Tax=Candidatus Weimeria bifida TaxID=2599074 RepID=A0A6N7IWC7_9FIRM|nr:NAD(P)-dependent glycerol-3-phosphate dehydrogenase [Candidatus Weimeria bifida]RRF96100.1 MAG: NAD(P)-dependent glycerol-3-phosphate dehydrogenase [Lachnospiraceae bacterium]